MNEIKSILGKIAGLPAAAVKWFQSHGAAIHNGIADAQNFLGIAIAGAAAEGSKGVATDLAKASATLSVAGTLVTAEANASTLNSQATALGNAISGLVDSGDIGIKNASTQSAVDAAVTKVQTVIGAMVTASTTAPGK